VPPGSGSIFSEVRIQILPSSSKNSKKNLYFYCFVILLYDVLVLEDDVNVPSKHNKQNKNWEENIFYGHLEGQ
jgi:hypothetical protein